jgi:hypothetical protein
MSLSTLATTSFSSVHDATLPPSAFELRHIILDDEAVEKFNHVFSEDATSMSQLRHISFISQNIKQLEYDLDRHHKEEQEFYDHIMKDEAFRKPLQLVAHDYRRRTRAKGFHPYHHRPLTPPPLSVSSRSRPSPSTDSPPSSSPYTTDQSTSYESGMSIVRAYLEEERQRDQPGSSENPIVVDVSEEEPPTYRPRCKFCHDAHPGQSQRQCTHHFMSPKRRRFLRQKMGLPENTD